MMFGALESLVRSYRADLARMRDRTITAAVCYGLAGLVLVAALFMFGAAGTIHLMQTYGTVEGLALAGLVLLIIGILALAVNAVMRARAARRSSRLAVARAALVNEMTDTGLRKGRNAMPALLPVAALLSFTLTSLLVDRPVRRPGSRES